MKNMAYKLFKCLIDVWRCSLCFSAFLALLCGRSALCWLGNGHNSGEDLYCQRSKEKTLIFLFGETFIRVYVLFKIIVFIICSV